MINALSQALPGVVVLKLDSTTCLRKFIGVFDVITTFIFGGPYAVYSYDVSTVFRAMWMHRSQFVWFRVFFIIFSRFSYMNSFEEFSRRDEVSENGNVSTDKDR